jgi:hypothetical protein
LSRISDYYRLENAMMNDIQDCVSTNLNGTSSTRSKIGLRRELPVIDMYFLPYLD